MTKRNREKGQAVPILVIAMSLVLVGGMGLAIDAGNLYQQTQLAQVAADAAATAAMTSIFQGVNKSGATHYFATNASFNCTAGSDAKLPCVYARMNGFGLTGSSDVVTVDFPTCTGSPDPCGYEAKLSTQITPNQVRVTITRTAHNSIIQMLGAGATNSVRATATSGTIEVQTPAPMIITDPWNSGTLTAGGSTGITICGGPSRSIQVNSSNPTAFGGGNVDLSHAGTADPGNCTTGTGADFGVFGGDYTNPGISIGTTGHYISKASPIPDPFADVAAPTTTGLANPAPAPVTIHTPTHGCIFANCTEYSPGVYSPGIDFTHVDNVILKPGIYYIQGSGGFKAKLTNGGAAGNSVNCVGCVADSQTGNGVLFYDAGAVGHTNTGGFTWDTNTSMAFQGPTLTMLNAKGETVPGPPFYNITFWENRNADAQTHTFGQGNGCFSLIGTIYVTNTLDIMANDPTHNHYQNVNYHGTPCSATDVQGDIVVSQLHMVGNSDLKMNLVPLGFQYLEQVALVAGGPHP